MRSTLALSRHVLWRSCHEHGAPAARRAKQGCSLRLRGSGAVLLARISAPPPRKQGRAAPPLVRPASRLPNGQNSRAFCSGHCPRVPDSDPHPPPSLTRPRALVLLAARPGWGPDGPSFPLPCRSRKTKERVRGHPSALERQLEGGTPCRRAQRICLFTWQLLAPRSGWTREASQWLPHSLAAPQIPTSEGLQYLSRNRIPIRNLAPRPISAVFPHRQSLLVLPRRDINAVRHPGVTSGLGVLIALSKGGQPKVPDTTGGNPVQVSGWSRASSIGNMHIEETAHSSRAIKDSFPYC